MTKSKLSTKNYQLNIAWLYPDLMNTYGDRGNIIVLTKRCEWRGIEIAVNKIFTNSQAALLTSSDLIFMGGAQDTQQEIVSHDLMHEKGEILKEKINNKTPGLYICGAYQFLGKYYITHDNKKLPGLGIFPLHTVNPKQKERLIGNVVATPNIIDLKKEIIGFENHGGRTYLEDKNFAFAKIKKGFGNNGDDKTEGIIYNNSIGTYFHGPLLPKNPHIADWLIAATLKKKYGEEIDLQPLDDTISENARQQTTNLRLS